MAIKRSNADILRDNVIINLCVKGLTSENKQEALQEILKSVTTDEQYVDIQQREKWNQN